MARTCQQRQHLHHGVAWVRQELAGQGAAVIERRGLWAAPVEHNPRPRTTSPPAEQPVGVDKEALGELFDRLR